MDKILHLIPEMEGEEYHYVKRLTDDLDEAELQDFVILYRERRKKRDTILIGALIGLLGIGGIQRFMLDQIGMGILYILTGGLCYIGTIVDIINYKKLTTDYNRDAAYDTIAMIKRK